MTTLLVPTKCDTNRRVGIEPLCYLDQLSCRSWTAILYPKVQQWCEDNKASFSVRVSSYRWGEFTFNDDAKALLFKLTWL